MSEAVDLERFEAQTEEVIAKHPDLGWPTVVRVRGGRRRLTIDIEERVTPEELLVRVHLVISAMPVTDSRYRAACRLRSRLCQALRPDRGEDARQVGFLDGADLAVGRPSDR